MSVTSEPIQKPVMKQLGLPASFLLLGVSLLFIILGYTLLEIKLEALLCITAVAISFVALWLGHSFPEIIDEIVQLVRAARRERVQISGVAGS